MLMADSKVFSVIICIRYVAPTGVRSAEGGKANDIVKARIKISQIRRNLGKLIMQRVKLFLTVSLTELLNLATKGYTYGKEKITGIAGRKAINVYHSGSFNPLNPFRAK